ncbi:MAG: 1-deoxy-D-xylulose-5-phosphate synthase [Lentisphaeria bacterium]|nr:1-deoxy-D-xylulose-5-phosphate synthase [Lentisphaeria bacterium]
MINNLHELRALPKEKLPDLARELREEILKTVSANGGHLASNLGVVELTIALHRVFDTPRERIFFDVGHQCYAHKLLTGRKSGLERLRHFDGASGFTTPAESPYDPVVSGHAGVALSAAQGFAAADPDVNEKIIAVIGDGSAGNGGTLEALNYASSCPGKKRLIVILNDNRMSISENVGAVSQMLNRVIAAKSYNRIRKKLRNLLVRRSRIKAFFSRIYEAVKSLLLPPSLLFESLGFRYFGALNGHDFGQLLPVFEKLRQIDGPILVHVITEKGHGVEFASNFPTLYHGISGCDPDTGEMKSAPGGFSEAFGNAMLKIASERDDIVAVSPAMLVGTGLSDFAREFPERCLDVGIAEGHALTFAAGLAAAGKRPVCAFYDTFMQRALDAVYHDIALAKLPVVIALDRSGAVPDGPTHHGIYNCGFLRAVPGLTIMTPGNETEIEPMLRFAVDLAAPVVIRYPRGKSARKFPCVPLQMGQAVIRRHGNDRDPVIWSCGAEVSVAVDVAEILTGKGMDCTVVDARFLKPFDSEKAFIFAGRRQFTIEDHCVSGGLASALRESLDGINHAPVTSFGWSDNEVIPHGEPDVLRCNFGLTAEQIAEKIINICKKV